MKCHSKFLSYLLWILLILFVVMPQNIVHGETLSLSVTVKLEENIPLPEVEKIELSLPELEKKITYTINKLGYTVNDNADIGLEGSVYVTDIKQISGIRSMSMISLRMDVQIKDIKTGDVLESFSAKSNGVDKEEGQAFLEGIRKIKIDESTLSSALQKIAERSKLQSKKYFEEGKILLQQEKYRHALKKLKKVHPESEEFVEAQMVMQDIRVLMPKPTIAILKFDTNSSDDISDSLNNILTATLVQKESDEIIVLEWEQMLGIARELKMDLDRLSDLNEVVKLGNPVQADFMLLGNIAVSGSENEVNARLVSTEGAQIVTAVHTKNYKDKLEEIAEDIVVEIHKAIEDGKLDRVRDIEINENLPRIMIIVSEEQIHRNLNNPVVQTAMVKEFWNNGFRVVDPLYNSRILKTREWKSAIDGDIETAIALGKRYGARIIVVGKAFVDPEKNAQVRAQAIDSNSKMILNANEYVNVSSNAIDSMRTVGGRVAENIIQPITQGWPSDVDGITPKSTNLLLHLNKENENNNLDYDAKDKVDWWRIEVPDSGELTVKATSVPKLGIYIALYGPSGKNKIAEPSKREKAKYITTQLDLAETYYLKVYVIEPGNTASYNLNSSFTSTKFRNGFSSYEEGDYTKCISYLEEALQQGNTNEPNLLKAHLYLGIAYIAKGWKSKAIKQFKEVLKINPDYELSPDESPKVIEAFDEARRLVK